MLLKLIVLAVLMVGFARFVLSQTPKAPSVPSSQVSPRTETGRYALISNPNVRADLFLLDTATGKIWQRVTFTDLKGDPDVWQPMRKMDSDADLTEWLATQTFKTPQR
jgi:hypothetical protein